MAIQNKGQIGTAVTSLIAAIATSFPNNTTKLITPAILRAWLTSLTAILTSVNDSENNVGEIYTKAAAETKRAAGGLTPNQFYFISDATGAGTKVIAILASAANAFHTSAINLTDGSFGAYVLGTDVFTDAAVVKLFDVTFDGATQFAAIRAMTLSIIPDGGKKIQLLSAMIENKGDGAANYNFTGYACLIPVDGSNSRTYCRTLNADGTTNTSYNEPGVTQFTFSTDPGAGMAFTGGVVLINSIGEGATVGNHSIRVFGTYAEFPI